MRRYETVVIIDPDLSEDDRTSLTDRIKEIIPQQEGVLIKEDLWGTKKLAYDIKKKPRGFYARYDYCGMGPVVDEVERFFRIDDRILKYLTVLLSDEADVDAILADMAADDTSADTETAASEEAPQTQASAPDTEKEPAQTEAAETVTEPSGTEAADTATEPSEKE